MTGGFIFSNRDLLLITHIVAICSGWLVDRSQLAALDAEWEESFRKAMVSLSAVRNLHGREYLLQPMLCWPIGKHSIS